MSAAAICVGVGSLSDPPEVQGLSHLLEHCFFKGSAKFSDERGFDKFLKSHGGSTNAETLLEKTSLYFDVQSNFFREALERFSDLIIDPLLNQDTVMSECKVLDCEFQQHLQDDDARYEQLFASLSREGHPLRTFTWGCNESLENIPKENRLNVCDELKSYHKQHYQAQRMTLVVQSTESVADLDAWVTTLFGRVPHSACPAPTFTTYEMPFDDSFKKIWRVIPVKDIEKVQLTWCFEAQPQNYRRKPLLYIALIVIQRRQGSLFDALTRRGWATSIDSDNIKREEEPSSVWSSFNIIITLTDNGMNNLKEVITLVFQFINRMRAVGVEKWRFVEMRAIDLQEFNFIEASDPMEYVHQLAVDMQLYSTKDYITGRRVMLEYDPQVISDYLNRLQPDEMNVSVWSKSFTDRTDLQAERWFGTVFSVEGLHPDWIQTWKDCDLSPELYLPGRNAFMARKFALKDCGAAGQELELISKTAVSRFWYKANTDFPVPKAHVYISLSSERAGQSAESLCTMDIYARMFQSRIDVICHTAGLANLRCSVEASEQGLMLKLDGFSHKLPFLFRIVIDQIATFRVTREAFEDARQEVGRIYDNQMLNPEKYNKDLQKVLLVSNYSSALQKKEVLDSLELSLLQTHGKNFFQHCFLEGFSQGNLTLKEALQLENYVKMSLKHVNVIATLKEVTITKLPVGCCQFVVDNPNAQDLNTVITNHYQLGKVDMSSRLLNELLVGTMDEPSFYYLRSKSLLGYDMEVNHETMMNEVTSFSVSIQSQEPKFSAGYVDYKIDKCLQIHSKTVQNMEEDYFKNMVQTLIHDKDLPPLNLAQDANENWSQVLEGPKSVAKEVSEVSQLKNLTLDQLKNWAMKTLVPSSSQRKLSIRVVGHVPQGQEGDQRKRPNKRLCPVDLPSCAITDIKKWKSECEHFTKK